MHFTYFKAKQIHYYTVCKCRDKTNIKQNSLTTSTGFPAARREYEAVVSKGGFASRAVNNTPYFN